MRRSHVSLFIRLCSRIGGGLESNAIPRNHVDTQSTQSRRRAHTQANSPRTLANRTWPPRSWRRVPGPLLPVQSASPAQPRHRTCCRVLPISRRATVVRIPESRIPQRAGELHDPTRTSSQRQASTYGCNWRARPCWTANDSVHRRDIGKQGRLSSRMYSRGHHADRARSTVPWPSAPSARCSRRRLRRTAPGAQLPRSAYGSDSSLGSAAAPAASVPAPPQTLPAL